MYRWYVAATHVRERTNRAVQVAIPPHPSNIWLNLGTPRQINTIALDEHIIRNSHRMPQIIRSLLDIGNFNKMEGKLNESSHSQSHDQPMLQK